MLQPVVFIDTYKQSVADGPDLLIQHLSRAYTRIQPRTHSKVSKDVSC